MRFLILMFVSCFAFAAEVVDTSITQDTVQTNDAINSPTSVMQNTQVNSGVTHDSFGGGVSCSRATLQSGVIQTFNGHNDSPQAFLSVSIPLGGRDDCKRAADAQVYFAQKRTEDLSERIRRENITHAKEIEEQSLRYADLLAKVCLNYHDKVVAEIGSTMEVECRKYSPTRVNHGHSPADSFDTQQFNRVSNHSH